MRLLLLLVALLAASLATRAQLAPVATPAVGYASAGRPGAAAAPDTAAALRQYFAQRRRRNQVGLLVGGGVLAGGGLLLGTANGYRDLGSAAVGVIGIAVGVPLLLVNLAHAVAYSKAREQRTLQAWEQHRVLPCWSRRALSPGQSRP